MITRWVAIIAIGLFACGDNHQTSIGGDAGVDPDAAADDAGGDADPDACTSCGNPPTALDPTTPYDFGSAVDFLYTGANPHQAGVVPGTIDPTRIAVIRGRVLDRAEAPVPGVRVRVHDKPAFGASTTRADGSFDLVVNGGGVTTLDFDKPGFLAVQRKTMGPIRDWVTIDDVVVIALDTKVTAIDFSAPLQVHQATLQEDLDGKRAVTMLFSSGTTAQMEVNGTMQPLSMLHVRATEYTVGKTGRKAMPGDLPPASGYTYAAELSVDEAMQAGATKVVFSKPVVTYVENFLGFPAGGHVPLGYYDRERAVWVPADDGRVIKILSVTGGLADLDVTGTGTASTQAELDALGITVAERTELATRYAAGVSLWRAAIDHFTPWDMNWPYGPPDDATAPDVNADLDVEPDDEDDEPDEECPECEGGSRIESQNGNLGERLPIAGTGLGLHYASQRVPGPPPAVGMTPYRHTMKATVTSTTIPANVLGIVVEFNVGGRRIISEHAAVPGLRVTQGWDGLDAYGRRPTSALPIAVSVGYRYPAVYRPVPSEFARSFAVPRGSGGSIGFAQSPYRTEIIVYRSAYTGYSKVESLGRSSVGRWLATNVELGGFTLDIHHTYDPGFATLERGNGQRRSAQRLTETGAYLEAMGVDARDVAFADDGTMYGINRHHIWRKRPGMPVDIYAGDDNPTDLSEGDGGPALAAKLNRPRFLAVGPDGSVYFTESRQLVRRILPDGTIVRFAGATSGAKRDEGIPATDAFINAPAGIAVGRDGTVFFIDRYGLTFGNPTRPPGLRSVTTDGRIHYLASIDFNMAGIQQAPGGPLVMDNDANLFVGNGGLVKIRPTGAVETPIGQINGGFYTLNRGVGVLPSGGILTADTAGISERQTTGALKRVPMLSITGESLPVPSVRVSPSGDVYVMGYTLATQSNYEDLNLTSGLYLYQPVKRYDAGDTLVPSDNGEEVYVFDGKGRHIRTTSKTGVDIWTFGYDAAGRLISVKDRNALVLSIDRDASGKFLGFTAPGGQKTLATLNGDGYLTKLAYPGGDSYELGWDPGGLLVSLKDRKGGTHAYQYDTRGRLASDADPMSFAKLRSSTFTYPASIGRQVRIQTAAGRIRTYQTSTLTSGSIAQARMRTTTSAAGGVSTVSQPGTNASTLRFEEGTQLSTSVMPDPRWGMKAPFHDSFAMTTPSGKYLQTSHTRDVTLAVPIDPISVTRIVDAYSTNGTTKSRTHDVAAATITTAWPSGRTSIVTLDAKERPTAINGDPAKITTPIGMTYDARGRLASVTGFAPHTFAYDMLDRPTGVTDGLGRMTKLTYDMADHLTSIELPSGGKYNVAYDGNGNLTSLQMPNGTMHALTRDGRDLWTSYKPGTGTPMTVLYNGDRDITKTTLPDGRMIDFTYDTGGRLAQIAYPEATSVATYADETQRVASVTRTPASGLAQSTAYTYDGSLVTSAAHTGAATGKYTYTYDGALQLAGLRLDSGPTRSFARDDDGHITAHGPFTFARGGPGGAATAIAEGSTSVATIAFDGAGREASRSIASYATATTFDAAGQPAVTTETIAGKHRTYAYTYDADGQLAMRKRTDVDAATTSCEVYLYDANGNRTAKKSGTCGAEETTEAATYDAQDRMQTRGAITYTCDASGFLATRGSDAFVYSARGELLRATIGGNVITYSYDTKGRRVRRTDGAGTTEYLYAASGDFAITHSRNTATGLSEYFYDEAGRLYAVTRGGTRYYVGTDAVGTPRIVTSAAGSVIMELEYDAFGRLVSGDPTAFELPVSFGGGIPDATTGLTRLGYRDYDPAAGRFTARDPALFGGGQLNFYTYARNEPIRRIDRSGLGSTICDALDQLSKYEQNQGGPRDYAISVLKDFPFNMGDGNAKHDEGTDVLKRNTFEGVDMNYFETTYAGNKLVAGMTPSFGSMGSTFGNITQNLGGLALENQTLGYAAQNFMENDRGRILGEIASHFPNIEAFRKAVCECKK